MAGAENREVHPQEEVMDQRTERQRRLPFAGPERWERLGAARQERCRKLLSQLLREVVMGESTARRKRDE